MNHAYHRAFHHHQRRVDGQARQQRLLTTPTSTSHLDQNQRYIQSLGFTGTKSIINRPFDVDTDGVNGDDNSHYSGGSPDYLAFGHGCVNDSEDADVILHEYGHAIQANINSSWSGGDTGAMGEGFGDYWAGSYSYSRPNGTVYHPEWVFSWDGHSACWGGRLLNRTNAWYNASKTYGAHSSVTENGVTFQSDELWSAPLFESMKALLAMPASRAPISTRSSWKRTSAWAATSRCLKPWPRRS
ncbi:hypothetical protein LP420_29820 [Massilia sp. B-10]|nr:hypothetical protein LP420_29820 [Massilia sp. B-10]